MNEHEVRARTRKATLIAEAVWRSMKEVGTSAAELPEIDPAFWGQAAKEAGVNPPSKETVVMVIEILKVREEIEARVGADPFAGLAC